MKQKRKVKSLISSNDKSNVGLTALLCLLGGILVFGAVALFTSSVGVEAAGDGEMQYDNGIEDNVEVLLNFKMAEKTSLDSAVNEMELTGGTFYMKGNAGIAVDMPVTINGYVNYLGGESYAGNPVDIKSNNITVIGGQGVQIGQNNANTTILGGKNDKISDRNAVGTVPAVMLGGNGNEILVNQEGSAIVGGNGNKITGGGAYDFILGGEGSQINGNNVIVGGKKVTVNGKSNLFAFSDGENFEPKGSNAFYLNVAKGLGLNMAARNSGIDSSGAVSFGAIDINVSCTSADVGVQGTWNGCLVGCTQKGADDAQKRWEMMDHGDECETQCEHNSSRCMVDPIKPNEPEKYTSYCTTDGVNTENSTQCAPNRLGAYENVIFETYLIDSDTQCPLNIENKCVFRCNEDYHLTGDYAGNKMQNVRCYKDCVLPWDETVKKKHNEVIEAYNVNTVSCSNHNYIFPRDTGVLRLGTARSWTNKPGTKKSGGTSYESCTNYDHKQKLVCHNGDWYIAQDNGKKTNPEYKIEIRDYQYVYSGCTLQQYTCDVDKYNLTQAYITSNAGAKDTVTWNNTDRSTSMGTRGQYELCLDWTPDSGNETCKVGRDGATGTPSNSYHYQLVRCQPGYSTGTDNNPYECKKSCYLSGTTNEFKHNTVVTGYTLPSEDCTEAGNGTCHPATIVCNDGTWRMGSKTGPENTQYMNYNCGLNPYKCDTNIFDIKQSDRNYRQSRTPYSEYESHSKYELCIPWSAKDGNKFECTEDEYQYDLTGCIGEYHTEQGTESRNKYCISNYKSLPCTGKPSYSTYNYAYKDYEWNGTWNSGNWVHTNGDCSWYCNSGRHLENGSCILNTKKYACSSLYTKPEHSTWDVTYEEWEWLGDWDDVDKWSKLVSCTFTCDDKWSGLDCSTYVPDGCSSVCGNLEDGESCTSYDRCDSTPKTATCNDGRIEGEQGSYTSSNMGCSSCHGCPGSYDVSHGGTCISYSACSSTPIESECANGDWIKDGDPGTYSSPNQGDCGDGGRDDPEEETGCDYGEQKYEVGATVEVYDSASPTCPTGCSKVTATCQSNGEWDKTMNSSCTPKPSGDCSDYPLESKNVSYAKSYNTCTYYTVSSDSCKTNYKYSVKECEEGYHISEDGKSCIPDASQCTYNGTKYNVGATVQVYAATTPTCPTECSKVTATCQSNGSWDKTMNSSCTPKPSGDCSAYPLESKNVSHAKSYNTCTYYTVSSDSCKTNYKYSVKECEEGYHISEDGKSCIPDASQCTYNGTKYNVGATVQVYAATTPTCPTECSKVTATCQSNGSWDKTMNSSCTPKPSGDCSAYPLESKNVSHAKSYNTCEYYTVPSGSCKTNYKYSVKECEEGYELKNGKCVMKSRSCHTTIDFKCYNNLNQVVDGTPQTPGSDNRYKWLCNGETCYGSCIAGYGEVGGVCTDPCGPEFDQDEPQYDSKGQNCCELCEAPGSAYEGKYHCECAAETKKVNCEWKPNYAVWVNGYFTQTWNGSSWTPSDKSSQYSTNASVECSYKCDSYHTYKNGSCVCDDSGQDCEFADTGTAEGTWNDSTCSCECPQGTSYNGGHGCECPSGLGWNGSQCVSSCSNAIEQQNCENTGGTWSNQTCSCSCPTGTDVTQDNYCDDGSGGYDCDCSDCGAGWVPGVCNNGSYDTCGHDSRGFRCVCRPSPSC